MMLVGKGDNDYDVVAGGLVVEVSRGSDGGWTFWNVLMGDQRVGGTQPIGPGQFRDWLNENAYRLAAS